jgi:hypothetical protein
MALSQPFQLLRSQNYIFIYYMFQIIKLLVVRFFFLQCTSLFNYVQKKM